MCVQGAQLNGFPPAFSFTYRREYSEIFSGEVAQQSHIQFSHDRSRIAREPCTYTRSSIKC